MASISSAVLTASVGAAAVKSGPPGRCAQLATARTCGPRPGVARHTLRRLTPMLARATEEKSEESRASPAGDATTAGPDGLDLSALNAELLDTKQLGKRGEALFFGQVALVLLCAWDPAALEVAGRLVGAGLMASAGAIVYLGFRDLGASLSPLPKPLENAALKTSGAYSLCRHPMYLGLILGCSGAALVDASPGRATAALALAVLLNIKAETEERFLSEVHSDYESYSNSVPRLLPEISAVKALIDSEMGSD